MTNVLPSTVIRQSVERRVPIATWAANSAAVDVPLLDDILSISVVRLIITSSSSTSTLPHVQSFDVSSFIIILHPLNTFNDDRPSYTFKPSTLSTNDFGKMEDFFLLHSPVCAFYLTFLNQEADKMSQIKRVTLYAVFLLFISYVHTIYQMFLHQCSVSRISQWTLKLKTFPSLPSPLSPPLPLLPFHSHPSSLFVFPLIHFASVQ